MDCNACDEALRAYLDLELTESEAAEVESHLESCPACAKALEELQALDRLLAGVYSESRMSEEAKKRTSAAIAAASRRTPATSAPPRGGADAGLPPAKAVIGGFEIIAKLGEGGMGAVYKARQVTLDRIVALKILRGRLAQDKEYVARFLREAKASARLNHPNIIQGIDAGREGDYHYFAMEFVDGVPLNRIVASEGPLDEKRALEVTRLVAAALEHACKHDLIHRDIKPENIMMTAKGEVKLCDLGLAKMTTADSSITQTGMIIGTPHYLSPEQARGESRLDTRTDIYSLGATLYFMLTGEAPFDGETAAAVMAKHIDAPAPDPRDARQGLSAQVATLTRHMMAKKPSDRPADPTELVRKIDLVLAGRMPVSAPEPREAPRGARKEAAGARRRSYEMPVPAKSRAAIYAGLAAVAAALIVAAILMFRGSPAQAPGAPPRGSLPVVATDNRSPQPAVAPEGRPGPAAPAADPRETALANALQYARDEEAKSPGDLSANLRRWDRLAREAAGTRHERTALDEAARVSAAMKAAVDVFAGSLTAQADAAARQGDLAKAFETLRQPAAPAELEGSDIEARLKPKRDEMIAAARDALYRSAAELDRLGARELAAKSPEELLSALAVPAGVPELAAIERNAQKYAARLQRKRDEAVLELAQAAESADRRRLDELIEGVRAALAQSNFTEALAGCGRAEEEIKLASLKARLPGMRRTVELAAAARGSALERLKALSRGEGGPAATIMLKDGSRVAGRVTDVTDDGFSVTDLMRGGTVSRRISEISDATMSSLARAAMDEKDLETHLKLGALAFACGKADDALMSYRRAAAAPGSKELEEFARFAEERSLAILASKLKAKSVEPLDGGRTRLRYDFDKPEEAEEWDLAGRGWSCGNGSLSGSSGGAVLKPALSGDVELDVQCKLEGGRSVVIITDRTDADNFCAVVIGYNGRAYVEKWTNGRPRVVGEVAGFKPPTGTPFGVHLERRENEIRAALGAGEVELAAAIPAQVGSLALHAPEGGVAFDRLDLSARIDPDWLRQRFEGDSGGKTTKGDSR